MRIQPPKHHIVICFEHAEKFDPWPGDTVTFASGKFLIGRDSELIPLETKPNEAQKPSVELMEMGAN